MEIRYCKDEIWKESSRRVIRTVRDRLPGRKDLPRFIRPGIYRLEAYPNAVQRIHLEHPRSSRHLPLLLLDEFRTNITAPLHTGLRNYSIATRRSPASERSETPPVNASPSRDRSQSDRADMA